MSGLPEYCIRGIQRGSWLEGEKVKTEAFNPQKPKRGYERPDGDKEVSINWEDDEAAVALTLKNNSISQGGYARLARKHIDSVSTISEGLVFCERRPIDEGNHSNPYHGNIVYSKRLVNWQAKQFAAVLAVHAKGFPRE